MKVEVFKGVASGKITVPPSKSYAHRLLISAGLSSGISHIKNIALSQDILATLNCLLALGVRHEINDDTVTIYGVGKNLKICDKLNANESGSTLRFFIPIALTTGEDYCFLGTQKLISRGIGIYSDILSENADFQISKDEIMVKGNLNSGHYKINGNISSQFVTGMLFALPILDGDSIVEVIPPVESRSYIDITLDALKDFGIDIQEREPNTFYIRGNQQYLPQDITVQGDWSNSAFLFALNEIGGNVLVEGLNYSSCQGDKVCLDIFKKLDESNPTIDLSNCPDLAPIMFTIASIKNGATFVGTKRLAIKESDRASVMAMELRKFGAKIDVFENSVIIHKTKLSAPNTLLFGHNDHRIVMSLAVISTLFGGVIDDALAINKSYPDFFKNLTQLNLEIKYDA